MTVENYYFEKLHEALTEIRDELRGLREDFKPLLAIPEPIMVSIESPTSSNSWIQLQAYFDEYAKKSYGS